MEVFPALQPPRTIPSQLACQLGSLSIQNLGERARARGILIDRQSERDYWLRSASASDLNLNHLQTILQFLKWQKLRGKFPVCFLVSQVLYQLQAQQVASTP
jgi:hypothetical protein